VEHITERLFVWDMSQEKMIERDVTYVPGLFKIFDEILVNAADNYQRDSKMNSLKVTIDAEKNEISIYNNGQGN
jgi:DNA topoisomerase-2